MTLLGIIKEIRLYILSREIKNIGGDNIKLSVQNTDNSLFGWRTIVNPHQVKLIVRNYGDSGINREIARLVNSKKRLTGRNLEIDEDIERLDGNLKSILEIF